MPPVSSHVLSPEAEIYLDTAVPHIARIFDYLLGGTANFEADREAAEKLLHIIPCLRQWVRLRRAFIQEAAHTLSKAGFSQFLDLGSGMPTENLLHASVPTACIVYFDTNPVAVSYGQSLFAEFVNIDYIYGDARHINEIFTAPAVRRLVDLQDKIAIGLNALPLFLTQVEISRLAQALYHWAHTGSQIFVVLQTCSEQTAPDQFEQLMAPGHIAGLPMHFHTLDQNLEMMQPWRPESIQPLTTFLGLPDDFASNVDQESTGLVLYAAFLSKETSK